MFKRIISWIASVAVIATLAGFFSAFLSAQVISGDLTGTVFDASGAIVTNATITAKNDSTGIETATKTTTTGEYRFSNLPAGSYTVTVAAPGFNQNQTKGVQVVLSQTQTANFTLQVGTTTQTVEVTEAAATIDTTTAQVQQTFSAEQAMDLPTASSGSGVINLSLLNAGVATAGAVGAGAGPTVGGMRPRNNNFTIEGIDNNSGSVTGPLVTLPNDTVAEFTVLQNQFSPEFGHSSGGQFNQVVKSGTNQVHGSAYEYLENRNLNAADNLNFIQGNPLHPRFDSNRFGGTVGGPIRKNKLFYFINYEYNPIGLTSSAGTVFAPTAAGYSTLNSIPGINKTNLAILEKYLPAAASAAPPASTPNGAYPIISNVQQGLLPNGPDNTNTPGGVTIPIGQISIAPPAYTNNEAAVVSIDDNLSEKDNLRVRFILNRSGTLDANASLPVFFQTVPTNSYVTTFSEYHTFGPSLTNEFRLGYNRFSNTTGVGSASYAGLDSFPNITLYDLSINIGPDSNAPQFTIQNTYQLTDNVAWVHGNHSFKFGFDGWRMIAPQSFTQRGRGDYEYSYTSDYLFDYYPDYLAQRSLGNVVYYGNRWFVGGYANDAWKVTQHLTLNLGIRLEHETVALGEHTQTLNAVSNTPGVIIFQNPQAQRINPMPRVGLAYSPGKDGKTSIRAGFGVSYDVRYDNQGILSLPPELTTTVDVTGQAGQGFLAAGGIAPNASGEALTPAELRAGTGAYIPNEKRPKSLQWNFGIQRVFARDYTFETRYLGTRGIDLPIQDQLNRQPVVNASNALPVFFSAPSQATLNGLTNTLSALTSAYNAHGDIVPGFLNAGFTGIITSFQPWGNSTYHGWANQLTRRFSNGLQLVAAYTLSHAIDDSTADVFSTYVTPRRPQDARNLRPDRSSSALDHRNRITAEVLYAWHPFKSGSWVLKNVVGNWEIAPVYTYQTGTLATVQSGQDSNLNGDTAGDRTIVNPSGNPNIGSGTTALMNSSGQTVGFLVNNPNAGYVLTPKGALATGGRNTAMLRPIDDVDMTFGKAFDMGHEGRFKLQFQARFINIFNHPQYTGGPLTDVAPAGGVTSADVHNFLIPTSPTFMNPTLVFSSNPRTTQLSAKLIF